MINRKNYLKIVIPYFFILAATRYLFIETDHRILLSFITDYPVIPFFLILFLLTLLLSMEMMRLKDRRQYEDLFVALTSSLENINHLNHRETGEHTERVGLYSELLALEYGLSRRVSAEIKTFAPLHDMGKISIPKSILDKPGPLSWREKREMQAHTHIGADIVSKLSLIASKQDLLKNIVLYHHEKWNGRGYPQRLRGEDIPIEARIVALADVYDALRMKRSYKKSFSHEEAMTVILDSRGSHFDPDLVDIFLRIHREFDDIYLSHSGEDEESEAKAI